MVFEGNKFDYLWKAYQQGKYTDLEIKWKGAVYKVHKLVICSRSTVFDVMCTSAFKESKTNQISLDGDSDIDDRLVKCLIRYLYTYEYCSHDLEEETTRWSKKKAELKRDFPCDYSSDAENTASLHWFESVRERSRHTKVKATRSQNKRSASPLLPSPYADTTPTLPAQSAQLPSRDTFKLDTLGQSLPQMGARPLTPDAPLTESDLEPDFHARMYAMADKYDINGLADDAKAMYEKSIRRGPLQKSELFLESLATVYTCTPESNRGLRDIAASYMKTNIGMIRNKEKLRRLINEVPDFAADVFDLFLS